MTSNFTNRVAVLGLFRELQADISRAIADGYYTQDSDGKLNLLKKAQNTGIPEKLQKYWKLKHSSELPPDQELLESAEVKELFTPKSTKKRQRPYQQK